MMPIDLDPKMVEGLIDGLPITNPNLSSTEAAALRVLGKAAYRIMTTAAALAQGSMTKIEAQVSLTENAVSLANALDAIG